MWHLPPWTNTSNNIFIFNCKRKTMGSDLVRRGDRLDDEAAVGINVSWKYFLILRLSSGRYGLIVGP